MKIDILSVNNKNGLDRVYMLLNSVKLTKQNQTQITYHLILEESKETGNYFNDLVSEDFKLDIIDLDQFKTKINLPKSGNLAPANIYTMIRCLTPSYFKSIDKMLYVDTDVIFLRDGIEQLWNTNINKFYMAGCEDIIVTKFLKLDFQLKNTKNEEQYINGGVILFNYKKIRKDHLDQKLVQFCNKWNKKELKPYWLDQSLLNYLFRGKIKLLEYKYNDFSLVTSHTIFKSHKQYLKEKYGYEEPIESVNDAVILHFLGGGKPWKNDPKSKQIYRYVKISREIWMKLEEYLKKL